MWVHVHRRSQDFLWSGRLFSSKKLTTFFLPLTGVCTYNLPPINYAHNFCIRPVGARAPSTPPSYARKWTIQDSEKQRIHELEYNEIDENPVR